MANTRLHISAECLESWAAAGEEALAAEEVLYWKAREILDRADPTREELDAALTLLSAMRYVGVQARILPSLMTNEARIAKKYGEPM